MVTELIDDAGCNSVGWFYETFNACFGLAPSGYHCGTNHRMRWPALRFHSWVMSGCVNT